MPLATQPKLLRILEDLRVRRLGGKSEIPVDARVLAATSHSVVAHLREEIYYRLSVFQIVLPPLRERKEDIPLIAEVMIQDLNKKHGAHVTGYRYGSVKPFCTYDWPGNVRELRNVIERATIVAGVGAIRIDHLPYPSFDMRSGRNTPRPTDSKGQLTLQPGQPLSHAEEAYIKLTLEVRGQQPEACRRNTGDQSSDTTKPYRRILRKKRRQQRSVQNQTGSRSHISATLRSARIRARSSTARVMERNPGF